CPSKPNIKIRLSHSASLDVTKQKDLSGFYRHLLKQTVGEEKMPQCSLRGAGFKGEDLPEKPTGSHQSVEDKTRTRLPGKGEENQDADSDLQSDSSDEEETVAEGVPERGGELKTSGAGDGSLRGRQLKQNPRDSRSPSEERPPHSPPAEKRDRRRDEAPQHDERNSQRRHGKDERSRTEGHHRRREDREDRHRRKDWEEEEEEEEKRDQRRGRDKKEHRAREKDRDGDREKGRGRDADRDEKLKHARKRNSGSVAQEDPQPQGGNLPSPDKSPELTQEASEESKETPEKPAEKLNKFAKRSNEETVSSARDRYLSRQMARVGTKPYVEKEED
ncbi:nuclear speckle splicing regulatory protein 1, partial [Notechis scutatus]|uniref:Nuclear speckle splicing regulatory protein 1 n=1 Tax=Notechis scutatus TaxID=8663 RepID=A0A6J1W894_9SAUR